MQPAAAKHPDRLDALFEAEYFPMGSALRITANHRAVLATADAMWARFPKLFPHRAMRLHVTLEGTASLPQHPPVFRGEGHLFSIVADRAHFAAADLDRGFGHICISREAASDPAFLRYHFLEPLAYVLLAARHAAFVHASCVALEGRGLILSGGSGAGKTCLAYACARRGWTFITGDAVAVPCAKVHKVVGRPFEIRFRHSAARLFPELAKFPQVLRPSGKTDIEIDPHALGIATAVSCQASGLLFLERSAKLERSARPAAPELTPISAAEARAMLEDGICFGDDSVRQRHGQALDRLARVPAFRLVYSDLDEAEAVLRSIVTKMPGRTPR